MVLKASADLEELLPFFVYTIATALPIKKPSSLAIPLQSWVLQGNHEETELALYRRY
jgi:hypothetical protein